MPDMMVIMRYMTCAKQAKKQGKGDKDKEKEKENEPSSQSRGGGQSAKGDQRLPQCPSGPSECSLVIVPQNPGFPRNPSLAPLPLLSTVCSIFSMCAVCTVQYPRQRIV